MTEHGFLRASEWPGWSVCPGRPWLEDNFPLLHVEPIRPSEECLNGFNSRCETHQQAGGAVQVISDARLDVSVVTGERHANATAWRVLIAQYSEHSVLEVWEPHASEDVLRFVGFAAFLQHALLHAFTSIVLVGEREWIHVPDDLYVFGQRVTEAAHRALSIEGEPATSDFAPGEGCASCRASKGCPGLARKAALELV